MTPSVTAPWSPTASDALVGLFADGHDASTIAVMLQRPERLVRAELARRGGEALWRPRCMSDEEYASWAEKNATRVKRPCADCPLGYAADMRAQGRCNGTPGGVEQDEEEGDDVTMPPRLSAAAALALPRERSVDRPGGSTTELAVAVDLPCPACMHAPVCRIKASIEGQLERVGVLTPRLDPALTIQLEAKLECSLFRPERPAKRGGGAHQVSPEGRERMRESGRRLAAQQKAKRGGVVG